MAQYWKKGQATAADQRSSKPAQVRQGYTSIATKLNAHELAFSLLQDNNKTRTFEHEYQSYVTSELSDINTDLVEFWTVRFNIVMHAIYLYHSLTLVHILHR